MAHREPSSPGRRALLVLAPAAVAGGLLLFWWLGWYPGLLSDESLQQWDQVVSGDFGNRMPATHTLIVWLLTRIWASPALVTLVQLLAAAALLGLYLRFCSANGVPMWAAGIVVILFGILPGPATATISFDGHTAQALAWMWLLVEVVALSAAPGRVSSRSWVRIGLALGMVALLDHAGWAAVLMVFGGLALWLGSSERRLLLRSAAVAAGLWLLVQVVVFPLAGVDRAVTPVGEVFAPEIAAVATHAPSALNSADRELLAAVAPLEVWSDAYRCGEGIALVRDRDFDAAAIGADPGAYRGLLLKVAVTRPLVVVGHRLCAAGILFIPTQPEGERFEAYAYNIPQNELGLARESRWTAAFNATKAILVRTDRPSVLWVFWRPGVLVWAAALVYALGWWRGLRPLQGPSIVFAAVLLGTAATIRAPAFDQVFPVYALALLSLPLAGLVRSGRSSAAETAEGGG